MLKKVTSEHVYERQAKTWGSDDCYNDCKMLCKMRCTITGNLYDDQFDEEVSCEV